MAKVFQVDTAGTLTTGLHSYYKMEDVNDYVGSKNLTNVNSVTFTSGKVNNASNFIKASSQRLDIANADFCWGTANYSINLWFKRNAVSNSQYVLFGTQTTGSGTGGFNLGYGTAGAGKIAYDNIARLNSTPSYTWTQDQNWHMVTIVARSSGTGKELYFDGTSVGTATSTDAPLQSNNPISFGARHIGTPDTYYDGLIDEACIWSKSLSSQEIADLYNSGSGQTMVEAVSNTGNMFLLF